MARSKKAPKIADNDKLFRRKKALVPLPSVQELLGQRQIIGRMGIRLPISAGGLKPFKPEDVKKKTLLLKAIKHNFRCLAYLVEQLTALNTSPSIPAFRHPSNQNKIVWVDMSELLLEPFFSRLDDSNRIKLAQVIEFELTRAFHMCNRSGFRLLMHYDMLFDKRASKFLLRLYHMLVQRYVLNASFVVGLSQLDDAEYHLDLNTQVIKVINDQPMNAKAMSEYLSFCTQHKLDFMLQVDGKTQLKWLKDEKTRIMRSVRPLIVVKTPPIQLKPSLIDQAMLRWVPLCRYADVFLANR